MLIFLAIVMGPGFGFMLYALRGFWLEAKHQRNNKKCVSIVQLLGTHADDSDQPDLSKREISGDSAVNTPPVPWLAADQEPSKGPEREKVGVTYLKNRFVVIPAQTGRLAVKRTAKG